MKQKRKVKSLLPQKNDWRSSFLTAVLLILSVALCIGSASLITSRVWAEEIHGLTYTGLDDKQEVLYGMRFVDRNDMETPVNKMYMKNNSLYITPNPVVVNELSVGSTNFSDSNQVEGVYGHVLGGKGNKVRSRNVTLIAGEDNVVTEGNDNAAFLGGQSNNNFGRMMEGGTPMVVVGGSNNSIGDNHDGVALIGGNGNKIGDSVSDSFILGGEDNEIESGLTNVIVGGKKVKVRTVNNVFVYSNKGDGTNPNDEFEPLNSNSFYLNVNGVGINTNPSNRGLAVGGVVNLGEIDIKSVRCDQFNIGVEFSYGGCVVGCTKAGAAVNKWEMLDRGAHCQTVCGDAYDYCIYTGEVIEPAPSYDAFCTSAKTNKDIFTGHSHMCYTGELGEYQNVVYETSLIDSDKECPEKNENKCVYQCDQGYHLTGNFAGNDKDTVRCYQDCLYEWADEGVKRYKHNETVIGYNSGQVHCARQPDVDKGTKNDPYPEHCGNNQHKKMLVCNNGTMYIADSDKKATNDKAADKGYRFFNCGTVDFRCNIAVYDLSAEIITKSFVNGGLQDTNMVWNTTDRSSSSKGDRGIYKLCLDYNSNSTNNETCDLVHTGNPREEHYKFVRCQDGYDEYPTGSKKCMQKCTVKTDDGATVTINHAAIYEFYLKGSETCTGVCIGQNFECNDGTFYSTGDDHKKRQDSNYKYSKCMLNKFRCDKAEYNVTYYQWNDLNWKAKGHYSSCDDYDPDPSNGENAKACKKVETNYKLDYCYEGYHTEDMRKCIDNVTLEPCTNQPSSAFDTTWHWVRSSGPIQTYPWSNIIPDYKAWVSQGMYFKRWSDSCSWNDPASLCWVYEYPDGNIDGKVLPGDACEWRCNVGYRDSGNYCQKIDTTCQYPDNNQNACVNTEPYACKDSQHTDIENQRLDSDGITWKWDCVNGIEADRKHCMLCKDGYHIENNKCVANVNGQCNNNTKYGCYKGYKAERTEFDNKYTWDCLGIPSNDSSSTRKPGPNCTPATDDTGCYLCKQGYHKTSVYGECLINECSSVNVPSGEGVIYGEGTPDTHNKSWDYVSTSELGPCEWTCDESEGYERYGNGCRLKTYTISYDENGGTPDQPDESVTHGDSVYVPNVERECHYFDGWKGKLGDGYKYSRYGPVYESETLVAQWAEDEFTVQYRNNGHGIAPASQTMKYSTETKAKNGISSDGYKFEKWCTTINGVGGTCYKPGDVINAKNECPTQDLVLYAQWTEKTALLTYDANDCGTAPESETMTYSVATYAASSMESINDNWTLTKWCKTSDGVGGICYDVGELVKGINEEPTPITLYAICEKPNVECIDYSEYKECSDGITGNPTPGPDLDKKYWMCGSHRCKMCDEDAGYTYNGFECVMDGGNDCAEPCGSDTVMVDWNGRPFKWAHGRIYTSEREQVTDIGYIGGVDLDGNMRCGHTRLNGTLCEVNQLLTTVGTYYVSVCGGKWYSFEVIMQDGGTFGTEVVPAGKYIKLSTWKEVGELCVYSKNGQCGLTAGTCSPGNPVDIREVNNGTAKQWACEGIGVGITTYCHLQHLTEGRGCTTTTQCNVAYGDSTYCSRYSSKISCERIGAYFSVPKIGYGNNPNNFGSTYKPCTVGQQAPHDDYFENYGCSSCCNRGDGTERCLLNGVEISNSYCAGLN